MDRLDAGYAVGTSGAPAQCAASARLLRSSSAQIQLEPWGALTAFCASPATVNPGAETANSSVSGVTRNLVSAYTLLELEIQTGLLELPSQLKE